MERIDRQPPYEERVTPYGEGFSLLSQSVEVDDFTFSSSLNQQFDSESSAELIDHFGYAEFIPGFYEQIMDSTRTNTFTYKAIAGTVGAKGFADGSVNVKTMSEFDGLNGLYGFLSRSRDTLKLTGQEGDEALAFITEDILENLAFVGEKEMLEASRGIADYWKKMLRDNSDLQLCIMNEVSAKMGVGKSDRYILNRVLENFSEEEMEEFEGRVKLDIDEITASQQDTKVIMLDDWSISGGQVRTSFGLVFEKLKEKGLLDRTEVHLLVASPSQLENGIFTTNVDENGEIVKLPVKSYFLANEAESTLKPARAIISGVHSAVNYDFEYPIHEVVRRLREIEADYGRGEPTTVMPPLTNIRREYR